MKRKEEIVIVEEIAWIGDEERAIDWGSGFRGRRSDNSIVVEEAKYSEKENGYVDNVCEEGNERSNGDDTNDHEERQNDDHDDQENNSDDHDEEEDLVGHDHPLVAYVVGVVLPVVLSVPRTFASRAPNFLHISCSSFPLGIPP